MLCLSNIFGKVTLKCVLYFVLWLQCKPQLIFSTNLILLACLFIWKQPSTSPFPSESPTPSYKTLQRESLIALYDATDGANWEDNAGWLSDSDECNWYGVTCNGSGNVTKLELDGNNLIGTIPSNIASLSQLGTSFDGCLLSYLVLLSWYWLSLSYLVLLSWYWLSLSFSPFKIDFQNILIWALINSLERSPLSWEGCLSCVSMDIWETVCIIILILLFCGIDTSSFSLQFDSAESLDLGRNFLWDLIPSELGLLTNLKDLYLWDNQFTGTIPVELGGLLQLGKYGHLRDSLHFIILILLFCGIDTFSFSQCLW